jgi:hypothetical protein
MTAPGQAHGGFWKPGTYFIAMQFRHTSSFVNKFLCVYVSCFPYTFTHTYHSLAHAQARSRQGRMWSATKKPIQPMVATVRFWIVDFMTACSSYLPSYHRLAACHQNLEHEHVLPCSLCSCGIQSTRGTHHWQTTENATHLPKSHSNIICGRALSNDHHCGTNRMRQNYTAVTVPGRGRMDQWAGTRPRRPHIPFLPIHYSFMI